MSDLCYLKIKLIATKLKAKMHETDPLHTRSLPLGDYSFNIMHLGANAKKIGRSTPPSQQLANLGSASVSDLLIPHQN